MIMQTAVVFESAWCDTLAAAQAVARGLRSSAQVQLMAVENVDDEALLRVDLVVLAGAATGPAASHRARRGRTRPIEFEVTPLRRPDGRSRPATVLEWIRSMPNTYARTAVFDVRPSSVGRFASRPSHLIVRELRRHEFEVIVRPETFVVSRNRLLYPGEAERAERWGRGLASTVPRVPTF
jgi:hypothetical protein